MALPPELLRCGLVPLRWCCTGDHCQWFATRAVLLLLALPLCLFRPCAIGLHCGVHTVAVAAIASHCWMQACRDSCPTPHGSCSAACIEPVGGSVCSQIGVAGCGVLCFVGLAACSAQAAGVCLNDGQRKTIPFVAAEFPPAADHRADGDR